MFQNKSLKIEDFIYLSSDKNIEQVVQHIKEADAILIGAGAGMAVDSGLPDFRGKAGFWRAYPPLAKRGLKFEEMANPRWFLEKPDLAWGFYGHRHALYLKTEPHKGYKILRNWGHKLRIPSFIFTSNVDGHFNRAGWSEKILECHGSLMRLQCLEACGQPIWEPVDRDIPLVNVCPDSLACKSPLPTCPNCRSLARPNILMFSDFHWDSSINLKQERTLNGWLDINASKNLLIIELGAGISVPTVRFFCERSMEEYNCNMVRINPRDYQVPKGATALACGALEALELLDIMLWK